MPGSFHPTTRRLGAVCLALCGLAAGTGAQQSATKVPPGEPARFLQKYIGLTPAEIERAGRGEVVTKVLTAADKDEIALFGIVAVNASRDQVVERVRDLPAFLRTPGRTSFGLFGTPASPNDARTFAVDAGDLEALKACRPGNCDVKMPAPRFDEFKGIDWNAPTTTERVNGIVRRLMAEYVEEYRAGGTAAMVEYGDQKTARRAGQVFTSLLAASPYLYDYVPSFQRYLEGYPAAAAPAGVSDAIYWSSDKLPSLRPVLGIHHVSVFAPPGEPLALVSAKQLYASHYFLGAFTLTTVLQRPDGPGSYLIVVQRMRFDHLPSGGLLNIRGRVTGRMHDALRDDLGQRKAGLERKG